ncbi:MAG TPA: glutamate--tRNA ligase [Bacteroidia bacterium]|jgi:glutamyl-tRNA synthetase|nr:glutamate--tRNA ligase [Bacteroidia bacterium]
MNDKRVRVRFAPSPTGGLHMGGVRVALFNYLFAKKHGGDFILRIEDTDQTRYVKGAEEYIINSLKWCGIEPNEGVGFGDGIHAPYRQSERKVLGIYKKYADKLVASGHAYYAFDTSEELDEMRKRLEAAKVAAPQYNAVSRQTMKNSITLGEDETKKLLDAGTPYVVRLKVPRNEEIRFHDIIRGWVVVNSSQVDDKVLLKSDGMPTYHLAHIVDDIEMKISHAMRGEEWLPSAPAHILIYRYLGLEDQMPLLAHLPLILKPDGNGKLSKRDKSGLPMFPLNWFDERTNESYTGYREHGFFPEAFINMLALLGWNPGTNEELFTKEELIKIFSLERVNKAGAKFDPEKTKWFNQQYLRKKSDKELAVLVKPMIEEKSKTANFTLPTADSFLEGFCRLIKEKAHFVNEMWDLGSFFFLVPKSYDTEIVKKRLNEQTLAFIKEVRISFNELQSFKALETEVAFKATAEKLAIPTGQVMQLFRVAITGVGGGPALFEMMELFGKEDSLKRLDNAIAAFKL